MFGWFGKKKLDVCWVTPYMITYSEGHPVEVLENCRKIQKILNSVVDKMVAVESRKIGACRLQSVEVRYNPNDSTISLLLYGSTVVNRQGTLEDFYSAAKVLEPLT